MAFSAKKSARPYAQKAAAILFLISPGMFSNNTWCLLATIFIVATAITELEFLQNLAAIIRGSDAYFRYKKEFVPNKEVEDSISDELRSSAERLQKTDGSKDEISFPLDPRSLTHTQVYVIAEELAFRFLERRYEKTISRHVRYVGGGSTLITFDGVIENPKEAILFEIIIPTNPYLAKTRLKTEMSVLYDAVAYKHLTKKKVELKIIIISNLTKHTIKEMYDMVRNMMDRSGLEVDFSLEQLTFDEIGLSGSKR